MNNRLFSLAGVLLILWIIGIAAFKTGYTVNILLVLSATAIIIRLIQGNKTMG